MSSSISSFRGELKVLAVVACLVGGGEIAARVLAPKLDSDRLHIQQFPHLASQLAAARPPRILFLGNSLTLHGVETAVVKAELARAGFPQATVERVVPVGTDIVDWNYLFKTYFVEPGQMPDVVIVGFVRHHVIDKPPKEIERLACHFVSPRNIPELFGYDLPAFGDRVQVLLSYGLNLMGNQLPMQERILDAVIPEYQTGARWVAHRLEARGEAQALRASGGRESPPTFERLRRFAASVKAAGAHALFVPMPKPNLWNIEDEAAHVVRQAGMTWVDGRRIGTMAPYYWYDGYHLGPEGADVFSRFIAQALVQHLSEGKTIAGRSAPEPSH